MANAIKWEKWKDPIGEHHEQEMNSVENEYDDDFHTEFFKAHRAKYPYPIIITPLGLLAVYDHNSPSKVFNFWVGHTNFHLTGEVVEKLEEIPGVETLDIYTPYRFRLGIGKAFDGPTVRAHINEIFCDNSLGLDANLMKKVSKLTKQLRKESPYYVVHVPPNGQVQYLAGSQEEVTKRYKLWKAAREVGGGLIIKQIKTKAADGPIV